MKSFGRISSRNISSQLQSPLVLTVAGTLLVAAVVAVAGTLLAKAVVAVAVA